MGLLRLPGAGKKDSGSATPDKVDSNRQSPPKLASGGQDSPETKSKGDTPPSSTRGKKGRKGKGKDSPGREKGNEKGNEKGKEALVSVSETSGSSTGIASSSVQSTNKETETSIAEKMKDKSRVTQFAAPQIAGDGISAAEARKKRNQEEKMRENTYKSVGVALGIATPHRWASLDGSDFLSDTALASGGTGFSGALTDRLHGSVGRPQIKPVVAHYYSKRRSFEFTEDPDEDEEEKPTGPVYIKGDHGDYKPLDNWCLRIPPQKAKPDEELPNFEGTWKCFCTYGNWDVYLKLAGMEESRIAIARGSKYGEGEAIQTITMSPELDEMTIEHSTMGMYTWETGIDRSKRSKSSIKIHRCEDPDSPQVVKEVMSEGICKDGVARVSAQWEADRLVMRQYVAGEYPCLIYRFISKTGAMIVRGACEDFSFSALYAKIDSDGDYEIRPSTLHELRDAMPLSTGIEFAIRRQDYTVASLIFQQQNFEEMQRNAEIAQKAADEVNKAISAASVKVPNAPARRKSVSAGGSYEA